MAIHISFGSGVVTRNPYLWKKSVSWTLFRFKSVVKCGHEWLIQTHWHRKRRARYTWTILDFDVSLWTVGWFLRPPTFIWIVLWIITTDYRFQSVVFHTLTWFSSLPFFTWFRISFWAYLLVLKGRTKHSITRWVFSTSFSINRAISIGLIKRREV